MRSERVSIPITTRFMVNSARVARVLALGGHGIAYCPLIVVQDDIAAGRLAPVLPDHETPRYPLNVVYIDGRTENRKIRALIDFAVEDIRRFGIA